MLSSAAELLEPFNLSTKKAAVKPAFPLVKEHRPDDLLLDLMGPALI